MKTKIVTIDGKKIGLLPDATYYRSHPDGAEIYKIDGIKAFVQDNKKSFSGPDPDRDPHDQYYWAPSLAVGPDDIIHNDEFVPLPMLPDWNQEEPEKPAEPEKPQKPSWEENSVYRADQQKIPVHLCPAALIEGVSQTLNASIQIKGRESWNWRESEIDMVSYLGKTMRHILKTMERMDPDDMDPETQTHHLECAAANLAILLDARRHETLVDNRPVSSFQK